MSCSTKIGEFDNSRERKTWVWGNASRCGWDRANLDFSCPNGWRKNASSVFFNIPQKDPKCGLYDSNNVKCSKDVYTLQEKIDCCTGKKPPEYCPSDNSWCGNSSDCISTLKSYCMVDSNLSKPECSITYKKIDLDGYNSIMQAYCKGENLTKTECIGFCKDNLTDCEQNLKNFCSDKYGQDISKYSNVCACYYDPEVYERLLAEISKKYNIPSEYSDPKPQCIYNKCKLSELSPSNSSCAAVNVANCFQDVSINADKINVGKMDVKSQCNITFKPQTSDTICTLDSDCKNNYKCYKDSNSCVQCIQDSDCGKDGKCTNFNCAGCTTDDSCNTKYPGKNLICSNEKCVECIDNSDCGKDGKNGKICKSSKCIDCIYNSDCSNGQICTDNTCKDDDGNKPKPQDNIFSNILSNPLLLGGISLGILFLIGIIIAIIMSMKK